jgi:hypothetical protein
VRQLREDLATELTSPLGHVTYPQNLTLTNFADYVLCPTLCYELEYPRTAKTDWMELFYKTLAVFGCIFLITLTTEEFILPVLEESGARLHSHIRISEGTLIMAETISRLLFPFMVIFLLVFLVIFEYLLGAFAEITRMPCLHGLVVKFSAKHRLRILGPAILLGLVEQLRLARVLSRMEYSRAQLPEPAHLLGFPRSRVPAISNDYHVLD